MPLKPMQPIYTLYATCIIKMFYMRESFKMAKGFRKYFVSKLFFIANGWSEIFQNTIRYSPVSPLLLKKLLSLHWIWPPSPSLIPKCWNISFSFHFRIEINCEILNSSQLELLFQDIPGSSDVYKYLIQWFQMSWPWARNLRNTHFPIHSFSSPNYLLILPFAFR